MTQAQELKLHILAEGLRISPRARAWITEASRGQGLSSADYASTSGVILRLDDDVWVNAPIEDNNPNFAAEALSVLDVVDDALEVHRAGLASRAAYCLQPEFHQARGPRGTMDLVVTHGDRARLSPMLSCAMTCTFCNIPFDTPLSQYRLWGIDESIAALRVAIDDPLQPARHILISGGTPKPKDVPNHRELYRRVLEAFPSIPVDIMMVPIPGILDLDELARLGVNELSINLEVFDRDRQQQVARQKFNWGRDYYLDFIESATAALGPSRVRSMLLVGLEPIESTLEGVAAIAERGGVPVLSPFRPDPVTTLRDVRPPTYAELREVLLRSTEIVAAAGTSLGPSCPPCTHNTLGFALTQEDSRVSYHFEHPRMLVA